MAKRKLLTSRRQAATPTPAPSSGGRVGVFISWSGDRSKALATALRDWIPLVLQDVDPFMSAVDIASGIDWWGEFGSKLSSMSVGILSLTPENLGSTWVHFEAGAIAKTLGSRVIPYLLDLSPAEVPKPLGMFQAERADRSGTGRLLTSLNDVRPSPFPSDQLRMLLEMWWPKLGDTIGAIPKASTEPIKRKPEDMLEEIVVGLRALQEAVSGRREMEYEAGRIDRKLAELLSYISGRPGSTSTTKDQPELDHKKIKHQTYEQNDQSIDWARRMKEAEDMRNGY